MDFANIPEDVLNVELGECYENGVYYLRDELENLKQDVVHAEWEFEEDGDLVYRKLKKFNVWTSTRVGTLIVGIFGDQVLVTLDRNPNVEAS